MQGLFSLPCRKASVKFETKFQGLLETPVIFENRNQMITVDKEDEDGLIMNAMHSIQVQNVWIEIYVYYTYYTFKDVTIIII